jgi:xylulokinase
VTLALGLDIGSTTTKAALVDVADGVTVVRVMRTPTPTDAAELIAAVAAVARACLDGASEHVAAVGIASMAESGVALGADGHALTPLLRWDRRVDRTHLEALLVRHPDLPARTGVPATTKPAAVALTALRAERPDIFAALRHWAGVADLVAHALCGERTTDHTLAARTMMAGADGETWDADVLETVGIHHCVLPQLRAAGDAAALTTGMARIFGLPTGVPVHIAGHDHAVGAWAVGVRRPGDVADSLGTAEAIVRVTDAAATAGAVAEGFSIGRTVDGAARTILGGSPACGAMLATWDAEHPQDDIFRRLAAMSGDEWEASRALVLPYPSGRQCPSPDPSARVRVVDVVGDAGDRSRAVLQALVLHARWMRQTADALAGSASTGITVLGSLAERIPAWPRLVAAAGIPTTLASAAEPVAAGAAMLAAVRQGEASASVALPGAVVAPTDAPELDDAYRRFLDAVLTQGER